jgi:SNF2 family DNA or RNA helicase
VLVLAPKRAAEHTWPAEFKKWAPGIKVNTLVGSSPSKRQQIINAGHDVLICNYELFPKTLGGQPLSFATVICDESHKLKSRTTLSFKLLRANISRFSHVVLLTGTPSPNQLEDLWSQLFLIDGGQRLGKTLTSFRERWYTQGHMTWDRKPKAHARNEVEARIKDVCLSMSAEDYLTLPPMIVNDVVVSLPPKARAVYVALKKELTLEIAQDEQLTAVHAAALTSKLQQISSGAAYADSGSTVRLHEEKLDAVDELLQELGEENLMVVYQFKSELAALRERFPQLVELRDAHDVVDRWNAGRIKMLAVHPASGGTGLNLQGGGRHIVWTNPTYNSEHWTQTNARLHRTGQTNGPVIIHRILAEDTVDMAVIKSVSNKLDVQSLLMEALK